MPHPKELRIEDFTYDLPDHRIAKYPLENRSDSKLLTYQREVLEHSVFHRIPEQLPADTLLVYNNTKVFFARLEFFKESGARVEIFCLEPADEDIVSAMSRTGRARWKCIVGNARRWKSGALSMKLDGYSEIEATNLGREGEDFIVELRWDKKLTFAELMDKVGQVPLPPYLKRDAEEADKERYQTVYSKWEGSVAAPTAGLHFTDEILNELREKGVKEMPITLHVGAGTFQPVKTDTMEGHPMHAEEFTVQVGHLKLLRDHVQAGRPVVVVGTTSLRALESLFWIDEKSNLDEVMVDQWTPYDIPSNKTPLQKLNSLIGDLEDQYADSISGKTQIIIAPGYEMKFADALITNFHQPGSTLLLLVSALIGEKWKEVYSYALANEFRFLSYGDSSILWKPVT